MCHRNTGDGRIWKNKREMSICATADVDLSMDGWDVYAWKRRKLFMRDEGETNDEYLYYWGHPWNFRS